MKANYTCQSCGMPLSKDPEHGGTKKDGAKSKLYCSYCYKKGEFTQPDFTVKDMQVFNITIMKGKMGIPRWLGWLLTRTIPKLKRWRK